MVLLLSVLLYLIEILHQTTTPMQSLPAGIELYLIEILHQTTTFPRTILSTFRLYLIEILHQTTTRSSRLLSIRGCILLKFYIKPQRRVRYLLDFSVLRRLSGRKTERENSVEVSLMCFLYFKERKYCFFRKIPTAAACPVLPVRSCPRS